MSTINNISILRPGASFPPLHVGQTITVKVQAYAKNWVPIPWPSDASIPVWSFSPFGSASVTLVLSSDGLSCDVTGVAAGTVVLSVSADEDTSHFHNEQYLRVSA